MPSALIPPRWVMQVRASMAVCKRVWLGSPCMWAIRPKPQLSLNSSGWYRPAFIDTFSPGCLLSRQISFQFSQLHVAPNVRRLCGGKRKVIVHADTDTHKFDDETSQIHVAFVKGLKLYAVLVKTFLGSTATTQTLL
ncbi:protein of unknown function [Pseudomonas mediterranea]